MAEQLSSDSFKKRQETKLELIRRYVTAPDAVLTTLFTLQRSDDPEIRKQATEALRGIFDRHELGLGAPGIGAKWGWQLDLEGRKIIARVRVKSVSPESPAELAGLRAGDILLNADGTPLSGDNCVGEWKARCILLEPGKEVKLDIRRGKLLKIKLIPGPADRNAMRSEKPGEFDHWTQTQRARLMGKSG